MRGDEAELVSLGQHPQAPEKDHDATITEGGFTIAHNGHAGIQEVHGQALPAPASLEASERHQDPPDGGWYAWLQVLMSHLMNFNAFGYTSSFGVFQTYYTENLHYSASSVAWVGTVNLCLIYFAGVFSGRAMDTGHYRTCTAVGLSLQLIGVFTTSISTEYWQLILSQGLCQGIGNGLLFCPAVALVATYFSPRKRALPVSCVACGGATGGMAFSALAQSLLGRIGIEKTVRAMGFVMLFNAVLIVMFSRTWLPPKSAAPLLDWAAFRELAFALYCLGIFLVFFSLWLVFYFIRAYALDILQASQTTSFNLLLVLNGLGVPGRLIPALLSDRYFGPLNVLLVSSAVAAILLYCWIAMGSITALYVWDVLYGFAAGSIQALTLTSASSLTPDMSKVGSRVGLAFVVLSLAGLTGPPIGGALIALHHQSYLSAQLFAGVVMTAGTIVLALARLAQTGPRLRYRV